MNKKAKLSKRDLDLIRNYLLGGAAIGGGAALATSAVNHLGSLKDEVPTSADDDDTIYLDVPATKLAVLGGGAALAAGTLGGIGSYAAIRAAYQAIKRKRLQEQLDAAQQGFLESAEQEAEIDKRANDGKAMSMIELLTSAPVALTALLGLGSGVVAHKALGQAFPHPERKIKNSPTKVVLRRRKPEDEEEEVEEKMASYDLDSGIEFMVNTAIGAIKEASDSYLTDLVYALAQGRAGDLRAVSDCAGAETMLEMTKGASLQKMSAAQRALGLSFAVKSAEFGPTVKLLAAAEFADHFPAYFKMAGELDEVTAEALAGLVSQLGAAQRADIFEPHIRLDDDVKAAAMGEQGPLPENIMELILALQSAQQGIAYAGDPNDGPETPEEMLTDNADSGSSNPEDDDNKDKDMIDSILSGGENEMNEEHSDKKEIPDATSSTGSLSTVEA